MAALITLSGVKASRQRDLSTVPQSPRPPVGLVVKRSSRDRGARGGKATCTPKGLLAGWGVFLSTLSTFSLSACSLPCLDAREPPLDARRVWSACGESSSRLPMLHARCPFVVKAVLRHKRQTTPIKMMDVSVSDELLVGIDCYRSQTKVVWYC